MNKKYNVFIKVSDLDAEQVDEIKGIRKLKEIDYMGVNWEVDNCERVELKKEIDY